MVADSHWLLRYALHRHFKQNSGFIWQPSKESGPYNFFIFSFINFEADDFRAFGFNFWKAPKSWVLKLETFPLEWEVLIYNSNDMCNETARNLPENILLTHGYNSPPPDLEGPLTPHDCEILQPIILPSMLPGLSSKSLLFRQWIASMHSNVCPSVCTD